MIQGKKIEFYPLLYSENTFDFPSEYKSSTEATLEEARVREEKLIKRNEDFKRDMKQQAEETNKMMKQMMEMFQKQAQP